MPQAPPPWEDPAPASAVSTGHRPLPRRTPHEDLVAELALCLHMAVRQRAFWAAVALGSEVQSLGPPGRGEGWAMRARMALERASKEAA